ncbi:MAG: hypothetical protein V3V33_07035 [Candidatus Lokiarchaeia archaeon]
MNDNNENDKLPILSNLEKRIILILGEDLTEFGEISRFSSNNIKNSLNSYNQKYQRPLRSSPPYSTLKSLEQKQLVDSVFDRENGRIKKFYLLPERGIHWYHKAKRIEKSIFSK